MTTIKISRNHATQVWTQFNEERKTSYYPLGWNSMGLRYVGLQKYKDPTILDRLICFEIVDKKKLMWAMMKYGLKYEIE
jgi:hypothetical protein